MEKMVDQIQTTRDRWFLNLHTGHTIDGRRPCLAARWPWLSDAAVFQSVTVDETGMGFQFSDGHALTAEEVLCALFGAQNREELGPTSHAGTPDETWMDSLKNECQRHSVDPRCQSSGRRVYFYHPGGRGAHYAGSA